MRRLCLAAILLALLTTGCSLSPGLYVRDDSLVQEEPVGADGAKEMTVVPVIPIDAGLIERLGEQRREAQAQPELAPASEAQLEQYRYEVGPGDVLSITVWGHPDLTIPAGEFRDPELTGQLVSPQGKIYFPYVGSVHVAGKTPTEIRDVLARQLTPYLREPQVDVRVVDFQSKKVKVTGAVGGPTRVPITNVPLTLLDAINAAGGPTGEAALGRVRLVRDGRPYDLDLHAIHEAAGVDRDWLLQDGDVVYVPSELEGQKVYVMGEVRRQSIQPMIAGELSLADALGQVGGADQFSADMRRVLVIRGDGTPENSRVYRLNANRANALLLATRFQLKPMDVVYVATAPITRWNRFLSQLLPSVRIVGDLDRFNLTDTTQ